MIRSERERGGVGRDGEGEEDCLSLFMKERGGNVCKSEEREDVKSRERETEN